MCEKAQQVHEERFEKSEIMKTESPTDATYIPSDIDDELIDEYLEEARKIADRSDDFLLQILYEHDYDLNSSYRCLRKVIYCSLP